MCVNLLNLAGMTGSALETGGNLQLAASGFNAIGQLAQGVTRARMSRADAAAEIAYGEAKAGRIRRAGEQDIGQARAQAAASGVSVTSGSVLEAERSIVRNVEQDALSAILTGRNRAETLRANARMYQMAGVLGAVDTLGEGLGKWKRTRRDTFDGYGGRY